MVVCPRIDTPPPVGEPHIAYMELRLGEGHDPGAVLVTPQRRPWQHVLRNLHREHGNMKTLLLIITVLTAGGPHGQTSRLPNATVTVTRGTPSHLIAQAAKGQLSVRLQPGLYTVTAALRDEPLRPPNFCEAAGIHVRRKPQTPTRRLTLYCSVK